MPKLSSYLADFCDTKIMVIGDIIADEFIVGRPERLSREAPVLILRHQGRKILPGGAANAAYNISSLKGNVELVGLVGRDQVGESLKKILKEKNIDIDGITVSNRRPTSLKTRVLAGGEQVVKQQVVRIDHLEKDLISDILVDKIISYVRDNISDLDGILLSDYGNGLFTTKMKDSLIKIGRANDISVAVDSRYNLLDFTGATIATPNLEEAGKAVGRELSSQQSVIKAGKMIINRLKLDNLLITQGSQGMTLFNSDNNYEHIPVADFSEVYDVTGAGDTVVGTLLLGLAAGADILDAVRLANYAAGIVVRKSGVAVVKPDELRKEVIKDES